MNNKRKVRVSAADLGHIEEFEVNGRVLTKGTEVSIRGVRGRMRFQYARNLDSGKVELTFVQESANRKQFRSFYPERVRTVHRINKTISNIQIMKEQDSGE